METQMLLYKSLCMEETLYEAWKAVKSKNSAGGIDGVTLSCFEDNVQVYISELVDELKTGKWSPEPYYRIEIPKKKTRLFFILFVWIVIRK